ncbi:MAG: hypothetical protein CW691_10720 [Candidatus Bathyarchaeum sp.]|nr:MAG: hypothetical protein CW691_10720 [Candidatus Bathyarchaeum sp.]
MSQDGVAEKAIELEADQVIVVDRWNGGPGRINLFVVSSTGLKPVSPLIFLSGIRLRRELKESTRRSCSSAVTVEPKSVPELGRAAGCLSQFFGLPLMSLDEASEKHRVSMHFSSDPKGRLQASFLLLGRMLEIGPRLTISKLIWDD